MAQLYASDLARRLSRHAEAVCRRYLSNGGRQGNYWLAGDVRNAPGRSTFVRLNNSPKGPAGKWQDAATGEHGDLLDVIRESLGLADFKDVAAEARAFLALPHPESERHGPAPRPGQAPPGSPEAARRLIGMARPIAGTPVARYLGGRAITMLAGTGALRFHPRCYYRRDEHSPTETWPAMIAAVTDLSGRITGAHRTWLDPAGFDPVRLGKAPIEVQRKAMGELLGNAVRFGAPGEVLAAGEGIETMLSLRQALPSLPAVAALSAAHLAAILFPPGLKRLYIARDLDSAGDGARDTLRQRARRAGIEPLDLSPSRGDFNEDLRLDGGDALTVRVREQLLQRDIIALMEASA
ncbi:MAG: DNA primase [Parvibaculum sp.]|nr:DNA primase [Parvibaculum sp.]